MIPIVQRYLCSKLGDIAPIALMSAGSINTIPVAIMPRAWMPMTLSCRMAMGIGHADYY